jgi:hypothetical protein
MEDGKTEMLEHKLLFDKDSQAAAKFFPEKRVITLAQAKVGTKLRASRINCARPEAVAAGTALL